MSACACGHEHDGQCINCLCPGWHAEVRMVPTLMNGRWTLLLPSHRAYRPEWTSGWEVPRLAAMADVIGPGDVVLDAGAEEMDMAGLWCLWGAQVIAVEPGCRVWPNGKAIFAANGFDPPLATYLGFVGDESQVRAGRADHPAPLVQNGWPACADGPVIGDHGFAVTSERPDIPATTIDRLAEQVEPPTVITIDVEGAEASVLRGADRVLSEQRPRVYVSVHQDLPWIDEKFPGDTEDRVFEFMEAHGYVGTRLALDHELHVEFAHPEGR